MSVNSVEDSMSSVSKALVILEVMALSDGQAIGVSDLAMVTDMPKSTAHRLLKAMEQRGFVGRAGSKYTVGARCLQLSSVARWSEYGILLEHAGPAMEWLFERTGETVHLAVLVGHDALYLEKINGRGGCRMRTKVGIRLRAETTAVGRVLESFGREPGAQVSLERQARDARLRATGTLTAKDTVQPMFSGVAAPVRPVGRESVVAGISVDGPVERFHPQECSGLVLEAAARLSRRLGPYLREGTA